ncbi:hypothetical protein IAR55_004366 [Kwoniella newhampshirensis]|uniref:Uncharacterized protein n=1 Tax=Kwoniella newhampshirensis TaxID=1651941 RepID=A0AAW0YKP7_9TREE
MYSRSNASRYVYQDELQPFTCNPLPYPPPGALCVSTASPSQPVGVLSSQPPSLTQILHNDVQLGNGIFQARRHGYHHRPIPPNAKVSPTRSPYKHDYTMSPMDNDGWASPTPQRRIRKAHEGVQYGATMSENRRPFAERSGVNPNLTLPSLTGHSRAKSVSVHVKDIVTQTNVFRDADPTGRRHTSVHTDSAKTHHRHARQIYEPYCATLRVNMQPSATTSSYTRPTPYPGLSRSRTISSDHESSPFLHHSRTDPRSHSRDQQQQPPLPYDAPPPRAPITSHTAVFEDALSTPYFDSDEEMLLDVHDDESTWAAKMTAAKGLGLGLDLANFTPRKPSVALLTSPEREVNDDSPATAQDTRGEGAVMGLGLIM